MRNPTNRLDWQRWRDQMISTFPLDDRSDEPRLREMFDRAFGMGVQAAIDHAPDDEDVIRIKLGWAL